MPKTKKRSPFVCRSKYERPIILLTFFPPAIMCVLMIIFINIMSNQLLEVLTYNSPNTMAQFINNWGIVILGSVMVIFILFLVVSYITARNLVGAFERIIRELDAVIAGEHKGPITARKDDWLANGLLERINILLKRLPG